MHNTGTTSGDGAGIYAFASRMVIHDSLIANNSRTASATFFRSGGGIYARGGSMTLWNSRIVSNSIAGGSNRQGGGLGFNGGSHAMFNCLVAHNRTALRADGIHLRSGALNIVNCTIVANYDEGVNRHAGTLVITNSIVWGHTTDLVNVDEALVSYSCAADLTPEHQGNTNLDPLLMDTDGGDFRLRHGSPCIDAGLNLLWMNEAMDLDGLPRLMIGIPGNHAIVDMGAYETIPPHGSMIRFR